MALTRKFLAALGIDEDKIDEIITAHTDTVNGLKDKITETETQAKEATMLEQELADAKKKLSVYEAGGDDETKKQYDELKKQFDDYKADIEAKELHRRKESAYRALLKQAGVSDKRHDAILKVTDLDSVELDGDEIKDKEATVDSIKTEWADFVITESQKGADTANPPTNKGSGTTLTKEQIRSIKDHQARQKAMMENASLFGLE